MNSALSRRPARRSSLAGLAALAIVTFAAPAVASAQTSMLELQRLLQERQLARVDAEIAGIAADLEAINATSGALRQEQEELSAEKERVDQWLASPAETLTVDHDVCGAAYSFAVDEPVPMVDLYVSELTDCLEEVGTSLDSILSEQQGLLLELQQALQRRSAILDRISRIDRILRDILENIP